MDAFGDWVLHRQQQRQPPSSIVLQEGELEVSEILLFEESLKAKTKKILNTDFVPWLNGCASSSDSDGILGVTRIAWVGWELETRLRNITNENWHYLLNRFELKGITSVLHGFSFQGGKSSPTKKQSFALHYPNIFGITWTYNFMTHNTEAAIEGSLRWHPIIQQVIHFHQRLGLHPLYMGVVAVVIILDDLAYRLSCVESEIISVESRTHHTNISGITQAAAGSYAFLSTKMSGQAQALAHCECMYTFLLQNLDWLSAFRWPQDVEKPSWLERVVEEVDECSHFVRHSLKGEEPRIFFLSKRANIQLTALFNLISQQENRLSRSVAKDSRTLASATKDDSTAMKTLAAVTVVFLPGTFVAALFSMPLFQWDTYTKPHSAISRQFWIYWATTLPLTVTTLALWAAWMQLQARRHRARDKKDKEALDHDVNEDSCESFGSSYGSLASSERSVTSLGSRVARNVVPDALDRGIDESSLESLGRYSSQASSERSVTSRGSHGPGNIAPDALDRGIHGSPSEPHGRHTSQASNKRSVTSLGSHGAGNVVPDTEKGSKQA